MKILNAAIVTTVLALGLAGNSMAAPSHADTLKMQKSAQSKHQKAKQPAKKIIVQKKAQKQVVKRVVKVVSKRAPVKKVANRSYRVRPGDTLSRIAARNHVSVQKLVKLNQLWGKKANNLRVGMFIRLA
ncbi:LysM peptidoglycan-binding domain-containing protein [Leucothrix arctica]|uniref:LysM domain-containing protein n=1 Tax=Leucothrix arctica TaxID=1481894 RepID=A0A317CHE9_9GAMM|nr:LysM domain-containing protein [Leucothrix arctica]PWQ97561.1 hypothetical protein DKT75_06480 [Leucothrix arctica]